MATRPSILVVDDDEDILEFLREALSEDNEVSTAGDALSAADMVVKQPVDLLMVDLRMPAVSGVEFIQGLRQYADFDKIPIVVISAYPNLAEMLGSVRVEAILPKPFTLDDLRQTVMNTVHRPRADLGQV